jgi:hypothetical protein
LNNPTQTLHLWILAKRSKYACTYNIPTGNEVAAIMVGDGFEDVDHRDVVVQDQQGGLRRISELHPAYMPMSYAFMFPYGEDGWHPSIPVCHVVDSEPMNGEELADESNGDNDSEGDEANSTRRKRGRRTITMIDYYAFRL